MSTAFLTPLENAGCLRVIPSEVYGDPYEFACTYTLKNGTCELHGVTNHITSTIKNAILDELDLLKVSTLRYVRIKEGRRVIKLFNVKTRKRILQ